MANTLSCDFCGGPDLRWVFPHLDVASVEFACDLCHGLVLANDVGGLVGRTAQAMVGRGITPADYMEASSEAWATYRVLVPWLGSPMPISTAAMVQLQQLAQQHKPGDEEWAALVARALEAS